MRRTIVLGLVTIGMVNSIANAVAMTWEECWLLGCCNDVDVWYPGKPIVDDLICILGDSMSIDDKSNNFDGALVVLSTPDSQVDITDILAALDGLGRSSLNPSETAVPARKARGNNFTGRGPARVAKISLLTDSTTVATGETVSVEAFVKGVNDLRGYQVGLEVTGGTAGSLTVDWVDVDAQHAGFVYDELDYVAVFDDADGRFAGALRAGGANVGAIQEYLGHFVLRASEDAEGTFTIDVRTVDTSLHDSESQALTWRSAGAVQVTVTAP